MAHVYSNNAYKEHELHYLVSYYWFNYFHTYNHHHMHHTHFDQHVNKAKRRKIVNNNASNSNNECSQDMLKTTPAVTMLNQTSYDKPVTPGKLGLISFRPHCDPDLINKNSKNNQSGSKTSVAIRGVDAPLDLRVMVGGGCKRRFNGEPIIRSRLTSKASSGLSSVIIDSRNVAIADEGLTTVRDLLPECLEHIFRFLDVKSKGRAAQVNRVWRSACYEKSVWRGVVAKLHLKKSNPSLYPSLVKRGIKRVQVLSLRKSLRELINGIPNLEELNLSGCYNLSDAALDSAFIRETPKLRRLNLSLCKDVSDNSIGKIASRCRNLESLDLGGCTKVSNNGMFYIALNLKHMKELNLRSCKLVSDQGMAHLSCGLESLERIGLQDCQKITDEGLRHLASGGLPRLKDINLSFCVSVTDTGLKSLARLASLRKLNLRSCDNISDLGLGFLADDTGGKNLEYFDASFCCNVTDGGAKHLATGCTAMKILHLANTGLSDEGLTRLAKNIKTLESLNISQCKSVTDEGLQVVVKEMSELRKIDLYGCAKVTNKAVKAVRSMPKVAEINLQLHTD